MKSIVIVTQELDNWGDFTAELGAKCQMDVIQARSGAEAIATAREKKTAAMVIDQELGDMKGIDLVPQLLRIDAFVHIALISGQSEEVFHEAAEGLGILMQLPPRPDAQAANDFSKRLTGVI